MQQHRYAVGAQLHVEFDEARTRVEGRLQRLQ
jgi:hypothetical protein